MPAVTPIIKIMILLLGASIVLHPVPQAGKWTKIVIDHKGGKLPIIAGYKPGKNPLPEGITPAQNYQNAWNLIKKELGL